MSPRQKSEQWHSLFSAAMGHLPLRPWILWTFILLAWSGCGTPTPPPPVATLSNSLCPLSAYSQLAVTVSPPLGWKAEPIKATSNHRHQVWLSPTGDTAFGVIYFDLPIPLTDGLALSGFLTQMKNSEGEAKLISQSEDGTLPGIRFVAEGGLYKIRCNLVTHGFHGWVVYAGSLRARPENPHELKIAELAREQTHIGLP